MGTWALIVVCGLATYSTRIVGLLLAQRQLSPLFVRFLDYVPIAVFAAIIAPSLGVGTSELYPRIGGALIASFAIWRTRQLWVGLLVGMLVFWAIKAIS